MVLKKCIYSFSFFVNVIYFLFWATEGNKKPADNQKKTSRLNLWI